MHFSRLGFAALICISLQPKDVNVDGFALSSSQSSKKKRLTNKSKGAGGFGKINDSVPIQHTTDTSETTANLLEFLISQKSTGLTGDGCEIGTSDINGIRGMYATKSFKKGEILFKIPSDCVLALSNPDLGGADAPTVAHSGRNFLDMYQNNPTASKTWAPYLDTLPTKNQHFDATPDFFTDEEIEAMEFPRAIKMAKERLNDIAELCAKDSIDFHELQFASWLVSSRTFLISIGGEESPLADNGKAIVSKPSKKIRVMVPYIDLINHSSDENTEVHIIDPEKDEAWFAIRATRPIKSGKEITIGYGGGLDTSVDLLQNYGFISSENKIDALMLKRGGDECIESLDGWSTTLEEDKEALKSNNLSDSMMKVLELRCALKASYP